MTFEETIIRGLPVIVKEGRELKENLISIMKQYLEVQTQILGELSLIRETEEKQCKYMKMIAEQNTGMQILVKELLSSVLKSEGNLDNIKNTMFLSETNALRITKYLERQGVNNELE